MSGTTRNQKACEDFPLSIIKLGVTIFAFIAFIALVNNGLVLWGIGAGLLALVFWLTIEKVHKRSKKTDWGTHSDDVHQQSQTPPYAISPSIPPAPQSTPLHLPSISPPGSANHPTSTPTTNQPLSQYPLSLSAQLGHSYYSHASSFSSPITASQTPQTLGLSTSIASPSMWPPSTSSSSLASFPFDFSRSGVGRVHVDAATRVAANVQPPAYPEVVADDPGLPPQTFMTPSTDGGSGEMFGPSADGLPSYEAAISTWQPPAAEEHSTPRANGPMTND